MDKRGRGHRTHIGGVAGVGSLEAARNQARGGGRLVAAAGDVDLRAADVELGRAAGVVDAERLNTQQIFAVGDAFGDVGGVRDWRVSGLTTGTAGHTDSRGDARFIGHDAEPPAKVGPQSWILNHGPLPS